MKRLLLTFSLTLLFTQISEAGLNLPGLRGRKNCDPCQTTRWYKAKDGTYREMLSYSKALSRAEDADDMEPILKKTQEDLIAANEAIEQLKEESAAQKTALEAQIAELTKLLEAERLAKTAQQERADKAESTLKTSVAEVSQLKEQNQKLNESLTVSQAELKAATGERDSLKTSNADLEKKVADLTTSLKAAEDALKTAQEDLQKVQQEAAESKKVRIEEEPESKEGSDADSNGSSPDEAADESETPAP